MQKYDVSFLVRLGITIEATGPDEAQGEGESRLGEIMEDLNEKVLGPQKVWLLESHDDKTDVSLADND